MLKSGYQTGPSQIDLKPSQAISYNNLSQVVSW